MSKTLDAQNLSGGYGEIRIVKQLNLTLKAKQVTAIIGSNGAGKSTLMKLLAGLLPVTEGTICIDGEAIDKLEAPERLARGVSLVPEGRMVFPQFTVADTLRIGAYTPHARSGWRDRVDEMYALFPRLQERKNTQAGFLSGGEQQMLAIARSLMSCPAILLLDEPSLGLAPTMVAELFAALATINKSGVTIGLVEQNVQNALGFSNYAYVMEDGKIVLEGSAKELLESSEVQAAYLGT